MPYLRLIYVFFRLGILNELQYRANFFVQLFQSALQLGTALGVLAVVGVFFLTGGLINLLIQPSMQRFMEDVRQGTLDFTLTKPEDAQLLVSVRQVQVWKLVDVALGLGVLGVALVR